MNISTITYSIANDFEIVEAASVEVIVYLTCCNAVNAKGVRDWNCAYFLRVRCSH